MEYVEFLVRLFALILFLSIRKAIKALFFWFYDSNGYFDYWKQRSRIKVQIITNESFFSWLDKISKRLPRLSILATKTSAESHWWIYLSIQNVDKISAKIFNHKSSLGLLLHNNKQSKLQTHQIVLIMHWWLVANGKSAVFSFLFRR